MVTKSNHLYFSLPAPRTFPIPVGAGQLVILPDSASVSYSDYCAVAVDAAKARFTRPTVDGQGFEFANPGARVRFSTNADYLNITLNYTNLVTRLDTYNAGGLVLADGVPVATFTRAQGLAGQIDFGVTLGASTQRTIEIVMPYSASVDFVSALAGATFTAQAAPARPATRYVAMGDSITHGFNASAIDASWPYKLAVAKGWQLINHGYGGRQAMAVDGTTLASLSPTVATYLIGYNNFASQDTLASFKATFKSFVNNFRAVNTTAKLYCITPTWSPNTFGALTLEMYRQQIRDGLTELGNALNVLVEGLPLATNSTASFPDNVHPNDAGAAEMATALAGVVLV